MIVDSPKMISIPPERQRSGAGRRGFVPFDTSEPLLGCVNGASVENRKYRPAHL